MLGQMTKKPIFDARAASNYDQGMLQRVPGYALAQELAAALLCSTLPGPAHLLIVGAGTGAEILSLAHANPLWRFTALDISQDMLDVARQRLVEAGIAERVDFVCAPMQAAPDLPMHDAGMMQLVGQFISHPDKPEFYAAISRALRPDALLLSLDYRPDLSIGTPALMQWARKAGASDAAVAMMESRITQDWHIPQEAALAICWDNAGLQQQGRYMQALAYVGTVLRKEYKES